MSLQADIAVAAELNALLDYIDQLAAQGYSTEEIFRRLRDKMIEDRKACEGGWGL